MRDRAYLAGEIVYFGEKNTKAIYIGWEEDLPIGIVRVIETAQDLEGHNLQWIWIIPEIILRKESTSEKGLVKACKSCQAK